MEERAWLLEELSADTYYMTDYYRRLPVVLARLPRLDRDALRDLLTGVVAADCRQDQQARLAPGKARKPASQRVGGRAPR